MGESQHQATSEKERREKERREREERRKRVLLAWKTVSVCFGIVQIAFVLCFFFVEIIEVKKNEGMALKDAVKEEIHFETNVYISEISFFLFKRSSEQQQHREHKTSLDAIFLRFRNEDFSFQSTVFDHYLRAAVSLSLHYCSVIHSIPFDFSRILIKSIDGLFTSVREDYLFRIFQVNQQSFVPQQYGIKRFEWPQVSRVLQQVQQQRCTIRTTYFSERMIHSSFPINTTTVFNDSPVDQQQESRWRI